MSKNIIHILDYDNQELFSKLLEICQKPYKVKQVLKWVYKLQIINFDEMTDISLDLRNTLKSCFETSLPTIEETQKSSDGTTKFLLKLQDGCQIEMVYIPSPKKNTLCISTQVGCGRGCLFCATSKMGLVRNLSQSELLGQFFLASKYFPDQKITNLVLMGMGEPLDNFERVLSFVRLMQDENALSFSGRRITLSTCGVVPMINRLADSNVKLKLAVSLNSAICENRSKLMPINQIYPLNELKKSLLYYRKKTNFRITFEYIMIDDFNMLQEDIKALTKFCGDISCKINLIKWNYVEGLSLKPPSDRQVTDFIEKLKTLPVAITLRDSRGSDITGACGQLSGKNKA
jgi:23S rRNA (adenine2503-C2)-methyltransferase